MFEVSLRQHLSKVGRRNSRSNIILQKLKTLSMFHAWCTTYCLNFGSMFFRNSPCQSHIHLEIRFKNSHCCTIPTLFHYYNENIEGEHKSAPTVMIHGSSWTESCSSKNICPLSIAITLQGRGDRAGDVFLEELQLLFRNSPDQRVQGQYSLGIAALQKVSKLLTRQDLHWKYILQL